MVLKKLDDWLPPEKNKKLLRFSIIIVLITVPIMAICNVLSGNTANTFLSQLSFSGQFMKAQYAATSNLDAYRLAEMVDFGFMVGYGSLIISLALIIARKFDENTFWKKSGYIIVPMGIVTACLDAIENCFIMAMLSNPVSFPNDWAIAHSSFALVKWVLLFMIIIWALTAVVVNKLKNH